MTAVEIILLIVGILIFILSFLIPSKKESLSSDTMKLGEDTVKKIVDDEMKSARSKIEDMVNETVSYSIEKTERSMDRLTNEKIMAVNEYSDTVLNEIHKNHEEVVFLYDMLNDKHKQLKQSVLEAEQSASLVTKRKNELEETVASQKEIVTGQETVEQEILTQRETEKKIVSQLGTPVQKPDETVFQPFVIEKVARPKPAVKKKSTIEKKTGEIKTSTEEKSSSEAKNKKSNTTNTDGKNSRKNQNEVILQMHQDGKSNMAIAKELGLGIGEVKLIIDLYKGGAV